jgi:hypothetical protein
MAFVPLRTVVGTDEEDSGFKPLRDVYLGPAPQRNALAAGISSGIDQLQGLGYSALGGAADILGANTARDWANEQARRNQIDASLSGRPDLENIEDQSFGSALPYVGYQIAKQVPLMAGLTAAQFIPGAGQAAGALGLTRLGATLPRFVGGAGLEAGASIAARRAALAQGETLATGTMAGSALGFGSMYGESVEGGDPSAWKALALSPIYGAAEAVLPAVLHGGMRLPSRYSGGLATRMAKAGGVAGAGETLTELGQNELEMGMRSDLTPEEISSRRLNSAAAGFLVGGGLGTAGGFKGRVPATTGLDTQQVDLMSGQTQDQTMRPADSQFKTADQMVGLQTFINQNTGVERQKRTDYEAQFKAAFDEPSGQFVTDPATGVERQLSVGEYQQIQGGALDLTQPNPADNAAANTVVKNLERDPRSYELRDTFGVIPTPSSLQLYSEIQASGIPVDAPMLQAVWKYAADKPMTPKRFEKAQQLLDAAIIQARKEAPSGTGISTVQQPAGGMGIGGTVVPGTVGAAGSNAPIQGGVGGGTTTAGAPLGQAGIVSSTGGQPSTPIDQGPTTRGAPGTTALVDTSDDALEIARATGNAAEIEAMRQDQEGGRADQLDFGNNEMEAVIDQHLAKSKNKDRDRKILQAYILARKSVPEGYKGNVAQEVADTFGIDASRVRQIGNPEILANIAEDMGFDRNQVFTHLGIDSAQKAASTELGKLESDLAKLEAKVSPSKADIAKMSALSEKIDQVKGNIESGDLSSALKTLGLEGEAGEMFASLDDSREWQKASTAGSQMAVKLVSIADKIAELQAAAAELKQLGLAQAEAAATERINALTADYAALTQSITAPKAERKQTKAEKKTEAAQKAAEEKDAAKEAEAEKLRAEAAAKRAADRKGLEIGDTVVNPKLGTGVVKGFSGDGDATIVTVDFQSGQTKELSVKMAKLEKTNAVQVQSTAVVPVQSEAQTGQGVGGQVRSTQKSASKGEVTVQGQTQGQVTNKGQTQGQVTNKGQALWNSLAAKTPGLVPYNQLTKLEQDYLTELAVRTNGKPVVAKEMGLQQLLTKEPITIEGETRIIDEQVTAQVAALPAPQIDRLEKHYGDKRDSAEFLRKVQEDITKYVTEGAEAVAGAIRSIIKAMAEGVLAMGIVFNPNITKDAFSINVAKTFQQTIEVTQEVPAAAKDKMSPLAQSVYQAMAPVAMKSGKWFMVADKPNGMLHIFREDGSHALSDPTLYGKDKGDVLAATSSLEGGAKITPAGKFTLQETESEYAGGKMLILVESEDSTGFIAVHAADTSTPSENRLGRLETPTSEDNRISYGCINTKHDTFINQIKPNLSKLDGGMIFVLPDAQEKTAEMFAPETRTETRTEGDKGATGKAAATLVGKEETIDVAVNRILRLTKGDTVEVKAGTLKFDGQITDEASLRRFPGVDSALSHYEDNDLRHVIDGVELWMVAPDTVDFDAAVMMVDGKQTLAVRSGMLVNTDTANWSIHHELGHIADDAFQTGGIYSQHQDLNLTIQKGVVRPMGAVVKEIMQHMAENPDSSFTKSMGYPLDHTRSDTKNMTADETRMEVFAQLWAFFNTRDGNNYLADNLPLTYDFMEINDEAAKQNKGDAGLEEGAANQAAGPQAQAYSGAQRITPAILRISRPSEDVIQRNISKLPKAAQQPARTSVNTINRWARKGLDRLVFTSDLLSRAVASGIKSAGQFQSLLAKRDTRTRELERQVERVADMYAAVEDKFKGNGPDSVNQFIFESTRTGKWGYGKYRNDEMGAAFDAFGKGSKAQEFIKAVFEHGNTMLAAKKKAVTDYTTAEYDARIAAETDPAKKAALVQDKAADLKQFARLFQIREGIPYAPIKRFGNHVVIAKSREYIDAVAAKDSKLIKKLEQDPDHYHVSFTETENEARNLAAQLEDQGFFNGGSVDFKERSELEKTLFGSSDSLDAITRLSSMAEAKAAGGDQNASAMHRMVSDLYLQALAESSARKSEMRRRGVSGELDMLRSFAAQGRADANFVASVQYNPQIQNAIQGMQRDANDANGNLNRKSELFNEIIRRYNSSLEPSTSPLIGKVTRLSSVYYLATSPAYYLQNLTQPWMMSVPAMAGRHDYLKASAALTQAYGQLGGVMKSARLFDQQFDFSKVPSDVRDAIQELVNRGAIDIGMETELGEFKIEGDNAFTKGWNKVDKGLRLAVQKVESINRLSTAMAAYRLELTKTGDKEKALNYAERILTETHGDYSAFNAPRIFNTQLGKIALQFRKFQLIQLSFYAKLLRDAGFSTEEKRAATKALVYSLGHTGMLAGVMGLPGYAAIAWAIGALFGDDDDPLDVTAELRKFIGDEDMANLIMRGAPTLAGMDISGKVGAGNMLSIMPFSQADLTTRAGVIEAAGTLIGGAPVGMAARVADGLGLMLKGDWYRGMEQVLPKGVGDAVKAYRIADQGVTRRNGDVLLPPSEVSAAETAMQALGIQPVKQSVITERQQATVELNQFYQDRSTKIKADYVRAIRAGESTEESRKAWTKLQEARVENGYTRQPMSELIRAPQSQTKRERQTINGVQFNKTNKRFVEEQV